MAARALRYLLAPFWAAQVFTGAKSFRDNPILGSERLNRRGLHVWRVKLADRLAHWRRKRLEHLVGVEDVQTFARDGCIEVRDFLEPEHHRALVAEVEGLLAPARDMREGDAVTRRIALTPAMLRRLPACARLVAMPQFQGRLRYVSSFDVAPVVYIQTIFSQVEAAVPDPQLSLHMDTFHATMKAWLFLHDVPADTGPFTYVPGTHAHTPQRLAWEHERSIAACRPGTTKGGAFRIDEATLQRLGAGEIRQFAVPGNTLVVGDTCGFHARGHSARPSVRVEIFAFSRRNPFIPLTGFGLSSLLRGREVPLYWRVFDWLERFGLAKNRWRDMGVASPMTLRPKTDAGMADAAAARAT
ncbi:phytanoyl-CoA dioxygenase family protein [Labrys wisconsinensis]|uniref:Phytanoyl-CoA dioxygenase n=1 Tax=Labrys wisconsinensis TaxID=425677 RepID=A0ABU0J5G6_9HYPH|nr:phytanoyl-CoA dioxygenase family protein [Labrys wisconsinensis]MDQ0469505.1 hypothetical protein [Labrys wisconsinensis]